MRRGEIWWTDLGTPSGSAPGFRRPVLIVQSNAFNKSSIGTVVVASLTSNLALENAPGNVRLTKSDSGLKKACVINVSQISSVNRERLQKRVGMTTPDILRKVDEGLRLLLSLSA